MKKNSWIIKALLLGTVFFLAVLLAKPIGVSTQFSVLSGIVHSALDDDVITESEGTYSSTNDYYDKSDGKIAKSITNPWNYDFVLVLLIPVGGYVAYLANMKKSGNSISDNTNINVAEKFNIKTYIPAFLGGMILLYGARMAGGCTSGHMMSGMMQGSVSGYIFAGSVFTIAIPLAIITSKRRV